MERRRNNSDVITFRNGIYKQFFKTILEKLHNFLISVSKLYKEELAAVYSG